MSQRSTWNCCSCCKVGTRGTKFVDWVGRMELNTKSIIIATAACALTTAIAAWLFRFFDASNLVALFMLTVVVVSLRLGRAAATPC